MLGQLEERSDWVVAVFTNGVAIAQVLQLQAQSRLAHQQYNLQSSSRMLWNSGFVLRLADHSPDLAKVMIETKQVPNGPFLRLSRARKPPKSCPIQDIEATGCKWEGTHTRAGVLMPLVLHVMLLFVQLL